MTTARVARRTTVKPPKRRDSSPVRVYSDGRVAYWTGGKPGEGKRKFERCGSVESAEIWAAAFLLQCQNPDGPSGGPQTGRTLDQLAQAFIQHLRDQGAPEGTVRQYKSNWNTWVPEKVGKTECGLARLWTYTAIFDALGKAGAPLGTVRAVGRTLAATIVFGVERGYFGDANPFASPDQRKGVLTHAKDRARKRAVKERRFENESCPTADDVDIFAAAMEDQYPGYGARLVKIGFATGLRLLELLALRWDSIDPLTGVVAVDWQLDRYKPWPALAKPKGGKVRESRVWKGYMDVAQSLVLDALERPRDEGWLFPRHRSVTAWADQAGKLGTAAHRSCSWDWTFHWLRHGFASWSLMPVEDGGFGVSVKVVQRWLGHSRPSTTQDMYMQEKDPDHDDAWARTGRPG